MLVTSQDPESFPRSHSCCFSLVWGHFPREGDLVPFLKSKEKRKQRPEQSGNCIFNYCTSSLVSPAIRGGRPAEKAGAPFPDQCLMSRLRAGRTL